MLRIALFMLMIGLFGAYAALRIGQSYKFFTAPVFCVGYAALLTGAFHWAGGLFRNEDLYFLTSLSVLFFWFGRVNYIKPIKVAEDIFYFEEVEK